ncbi:hypothetical protein [Amycolatopsis saalfeldensis]|uniref:hypothetical protein n=1 Tax=Amycolatopsis saalfeldensis TaxID=394193 RepID=UPI001160CEE5|nr:hypothetical protein [Amycolatopsis saalfeldensis]
MTDELDEPAARRREQPAVVPGRPEQLLVRMVFVGLLAQSGWSAASRRVVTVAAIAGAVAVLFAMLMCAFFGAIHRTRPARP